MLSKFLNKPAVFLFLGLAFLFGQTASATPVCTSGTAASYENTTCTVGNFQFTFGSNLYLYGADDVNVPASAVTMTPYGTGTPGDPTGFTFSAANWIATNPDRSGLNSADINISFSALLLAPLPYAIRNTSLTLDVTIANASGNSAVLAGENVTNNANSSSLGSIDLTVAGNNDAESILAGGTPLSGTTYFQAYNVGINKDINLLALDTNSVQVNSILETFTYSSAAVPEPGPFVLTAAGIGLLFLVRRRKQTLKVLGAVAVITIVAASAHATPVCTSASLQTYIANGQCAINGVVFDFTPSSYSATGTGTAPTASGVVVSPIINGNQIGFQFTPNAPAPVTVGTQTEHLTITYTAIATQQIKTFASQDTVSTHGTGTFSGSTAKLTKGATTLSTVTFPTTTSGGGMGTPAFAAVLPGTLLTITNTFTLSSSGSGITNNTHLSNFTNTLTQTPEPLTSALCGVGLLVLGCAFRSRKNRD